jgi:hypothetical protein
MASIADLRWLRQKDCVWPARSGARTAGCVASLPLAGQRQQGGESAEAGWSTHAPPFID